MEEDALVAVSPLELRYHSIAVHEAYVGASAHMSRQTLQELGRELRFDVGQWRGRKHRPCRSRVDADDDVVTVDVRSPRCVEQVLRGADDSAGLSALHALSIASLQGGDTLGVLNADPVAEEHAAILARSHRPHTGRPAEVHVRELLARDPVVEVVRHLEGLRGIVASEPDAVPPVDPSRTIREHVADHARLRGGILRLLVFAVMGVIRLWLHCFCRAALAGLVLRVLLCICGMAQARAETNAREEQGHEDRGCPGFHVGSISRENQMRLRGDGCSSQNGP
mmetsp:Transcript_108254/g.338790  ORF Transcript_108254/g.338790 Transcript_108254/m.338790 type:complete len:281 (-) Transcript_108254:3-845(-)